MIGEDPQFLGSHQSAVRDELERFAEQVVDEEALSHCDGRGPVLGSLSSLTSSSTTVGTAPLRRIPGGYGHQSVRLLARRSVSCQVTWMKGPPLKFVLVSLLSFHFQFDSSSSILPGLPAFLHHPRPRIQRVHGETCVESASARPVGCHQSVFRQGSPALAAHHPDGTGTAVVQWQQRDRA